MQPIQINVRIDLGLDGRLFALLSSVAGRRAPAQGLPEADAAREGTPATTLPGAKPEVEDKPAPAREEAPARPEGGTEVDVRAAMDRARRRIEGEDYKENPDGEGYKRWHRALTAWFKGTAAFCGADKPSALPDGESRARFIAACDAVQVIGGELTEPLPF